MQRRVTANFRRRSKKFYAIIAVVIVFFVVFFCIFCACLSSTHLTCFDEAECYYVYTHKANRENIVKNYAGELQSLGGAGYIYQKSGVFYLIASVYSSKKDAEEILVGVKENFPNAGILTLKTEKISRRVAAVLKENSSTLLFFKYFEELIEKSERLSMQYLAGIVSENVLLVSLLDEKLELENKISEFEKENELFCTVFSYMNLCKMYIDDFFSKFFETTKKDAVVCLLPVELTVLRYEFWNNLQSA